MSAIDGTGELRKAPAVLLIGALLAAAAAWTSAAEASQSAKKGTPSAGPTRNSQQAPSTQQQRALQSEQQDLRNELAKLKRNLAASEASRSEATDALAVSEAAISAASRRLRELGASRAQVEQQIAALAAREREVSRHQGQQQTELNLVLRQLQALSLQDPMQQFIAGESAAQLDREVGYLGYIGRTASSNLQRLQERRVELTELQAESQEKRAELLKITGDEVKSREILQKQSEQRKRVLAQLSRQISAQKQSIAQAERDDKRLSTLIESISKVLAEQARREAERARLEAEKRAQAKNRPKPSPAPETAPSPGIASNGAVSPPTSSNFGQRKGQLALPVNGTITARFGTPRRVDGGSGGPTWKGIFIRAPAGADVRAVGNGTVVFSDWLRGFGNLLVVDHGDGFLSIYGNNESIFRNIGDKVAVGETVASVGNTGGNETPGLYFELRFQGRPFDPLTWVAAR